MAGRVNSAFDAVVFDGSSWFVSEHAELTWIYHRFGTPLPRTASAQSWEPAGPPLAGSLVFFGGEDGQQPGHIGTICGQSDPER